MSDLPEPIIYGEHRRLDAIRKHWDDRAALGEKAGTKDLILKQLEQRAILAEVLRGYPDSILEVGCGTGELAYLVLDQRPIARGYVAIDSSPAMIAKAEARKAFGRKPIFDVRPVGNLRQWDLPVGRFELAISERCIINLPTWEEQKAAIDAIATRLEPRGLFVMCEHGQEGLDAINAERARLELPAIQMPWHNRYLRHDELQTITSLKLIRCIPFSATYYWLSRVINAKLAADKGEQPEYDSPINQLALTLPYWSVDPKFAQGRLWIWEKP